MLRYKNIRAAYQKLKGILFKVLLLVFALAVFFVCLYTVYLNALKDLNKELLEGLRCVERNVRQDLQYASEKITQYGQLIAQLPQAPEVNDLTKIIGFRTEESKDNWLAIGWADSQDKVIYDQKNIILLINSLMPLNVSLLNCVINNQDMFTHLW